VSATYYFYQDSIQQASEDTVGSLRKFSTEEVSDIFFAMEKRERALDSIARVRSYQNWLRTQEESRSEGFDTSAVPYNFSGSPLTMPDNALLGFSGKFYSARDTSKPVFIEASETTEPLIHQTINETPVVRSVIRDQALRPDWLLGVIIGSLVLLAWIKLFFSKFLDQTIQSLGNYQLSAKLLRDQSIFSKRVAFALNLNFVMVTGALVYLLMEYFGLKLFPYKGFLNYLSYSLLIAMLILLRYLVNNFIGHVFRKQNEFRDYLHQLLIIYKNLGIYLLGLVAGIAYINEEFRVYLVWFALVLVIAGVSFRLFKGLQIVLNYKDVLIFYMILYLCTLEILPLLIFYRFFSLSVQAG
jgi:hypothetical protein